MSFLNKAVLGAVACFRGRREVDRDTSTSRHEVSNTEIVLD
jgi:hypothetical protein